MLLFQGCEWCWRGEKTANGAADAVGGDDDNTRRYDWANIILSLDSCNVCFLFAVANIPAPMAVGWSVDLCVWCAISVFFCFGTGASFFL